MAHPSALDEPVVRPDAERARMIVARLRVAARARDLYAPIPGSPRAHTHAYFIRSGERVEPFGDNWLLTTETYRAAVRAAVEAEGWTFSAA